MIMDKRNWQDNITAYLEGQLSAEETDQFKAELKVNTALQKEVAAYQQLFKAMADEPILKPTAKLSNNFDKMLQEEKAKAVKVVALTNTSNKRSFSVWKIAANIAVLIGAFLMGRYTTQHALQESLVSTQKQVLQYKEATLISLLGNESASKRIQGVQLMQEFDHPDTAIVAALGEKMLSDKNTNVRLSAMEALARFSYSDQVKHFFIKALETEDNPSIQVALINILGELQEKKAIAPLKKLLEKEDTQPFIKEEINTTIPKII